MSDYNININTPDVGPYTELKPFRFWCQKVLPLVYDESLSYYELLCKVVDYLNKTMEDVDQMITDMDEFKTADTEFKTEVRDAYIALGRKFDQLQIYVDTYFDSLDVQTAINNKLDAMVAAGYFDTLFNTLFTDDIITEAGNVTSAWIADNLSQETGYVIDKSLTVADAAADAGATGSALKGKMRKKQPLVVNAYEFMPLANSQPANLIANLARYTTEDGNNNAIFMLNTVADNETADIVSGGTGLISDIDTYTGKWAAAISYDDGVNWSICFVEYLNPDKITILPAPTTTKNGAMLSNLWEDSQHLNHAGFLAWVQAICNQKKKHCEKQNVIAKFIPKVGITSPFTSYGGAMYASITRTNPYYTASHFFTGNRFDRYIKANSATTETTGERGVTWDIPVNYKTGYVELNIGGSQTGIFKRPAGYEIYIELYEDSVRTKQVIKSTNAIEPIYLDFSGAETIQLKIYQLNQNYLNQNGAGFAVSSVFVFENITYTDPNEPLFTPGAVVAQMWDSWGVNQNGTTAKEFSRLINEEIGVSVPYENHSLGGKTSAWGKAWFYENVEKYKPAVACFDFGINDYNSIPYSLPATVLGPDGKEYDNRLTEEEYRANIKILYQECLANDITAIFCSPCDVWGTWYLNLYDLDSE